MGYPLWYSWASLVAQLVKNPPAGGRPGFDPWLGRSPGEGKVYPLQYSGLENSMDCIAHGVTKSWTRLSDFHFLYSPIICWLALLSLELFHERRKGFRGQIHLKSVLSYSSSLGLHSANDHTEDSEVTQSKPIAFEIRKSEGRAAQWVGSNGRIIALSDLLNLSARKFPSGGMLSALLQMWVWR